MWQVFETTAAAKIIAALPRVEAEKYQIWLQIVRIQGPQGLRAIKSFHDEKLSGDRKHQRSSRLSIKRRVIYTVESATVTVTVEEVTPHEY